MLTNAKQITTIAILIAITSSIATYAWNNQTLSEMVEEHNQQILSDCLTKARVQKTAKEILEYASNCNKDILTNISTPRSVETITGTGEISCPELYYSGKTIESPRNGVTFYFTKEEVKELYPDCKIGTHSTGNTVQPLGFQLIPQASAKEQTLGLNDVSVQTNESVSPAKIITNSNISTVTDKIRSPKQIYEQVKHLGYREAPTISLIQSCKASSLRPDHCILVGLTLMYNEAGNKQNSKACIDRNNCMGIKSGKMSYSSLDEGMENWTQKFNRYWFKAESAGFFYSSAGKVSKSRYCVSEESSNTEIGCPRGLSIATAKWNQLYPIIYK